MSPDLFAAKALRSPYFFHVSVMLIRPARLPESLVSDDCDGVHLRTFITLLCGGGEPARAWVNSPSRTAAGFST